MPADITVKYTTTNDGTTPEDPRTSGSSQTGTGDGVTVPWSGGTLKIRAYAIDQAGNESTVKSATFTVDSAAGPQQVLALINEQREAQSLQPMNWNVAWAAACAGHSEQIYIGENGSGLGGEGSLVARWSLDDPEKRQLMDFDDDPSTGYFIQAQAVAIGFHASGPVEFFNIMWGSPQIQEYLLDPAATHLGCGFYGDVWEAMWTYNP
jgi:uncharacterized protein YkwD